MLEDQLGADVYRIGDDEFCAVALPLEYEEFDRMTRSLTARFAEADPLPKKARRALDGHIRKLLEPAASEARLHEPTLAIGTSGTLLTFARIAAARSEDEPSSFDGYRVDRATVEATIEVDGVLTSTCRGTFVAVKPGHPAYHRW